MVNAAEALDRGFVGEVVASDALDARLLEYCDAIRATGTRSPSVRPNASWRDHCS